MTGPGAMLRGLPTHRQEGFVLAAAVGIIAVTFGVLTDAVGLGLAQIVVMSALLFPGGSSSPQ